MIKMPKITKKLRKLMRKRLVRALLSGRYQQVRGCLNDGTGGYCCLGVACEIALKHFPSIVVKEQLYSKEEISYDGDVSLLPRKVKDLYGFTLEDGSFKDGKKSTSLAVLNDDGESFESIAEVIKSEPTGLFVN